MPKKTTWHLPTGFIPLYLYTFIVAKDWDNFYVDALHLSIPAQGLPNGEAALQHAAAYPGMQPYPGVGEWSSVCHFFQMSFFPILMSQHNIFQDV
jgi:hypothetical protein